VDKNIITQIDDIVAGSPDIKSTLESLGLPTSVRDVTTVNTTSTLGLVNGKILVDFYPSETSSFHITGGFFIGPKKLVKIRGEMVEAVRILDVLSEHDEHLFNETYVNITINGVEYSISGNDIRNIDGELVINSVKPYLGIGFGRAIPKRRVGLNFEIGAYYHGTPKLTSNKVNVQKAIDNELYGVNEFLKKLPVYPVLSLKINIGL
jgi:ribosomal protein L30/L7E